MSVMMKTAPSDAGDIEKGKKVLLKQHSLASAKEVNLAERSKLIKDRLAEAFLVFQDYVDDQKYELAIKFLRDPFTDIEKIEDKYEAKITWGMFGKKAGVEKQVG